MDNDISDNQLIDPNLVSYEKFFDHEWCRSTYETAKNTSLENAVDTLMMTWRSTNGAHILPWLMVESLKHFSEGEIRGSQQFRANYSDTLIKMLVDNIEARMKYCLNFDQRSTLRRAVNNIEEDAHKTIEKERNEMRFDVSGYWNSLIESPEFIFCILGIQRINYSSLYFAYEDFLANVIRTEVPTYTSKKTRIEIEFPKQFGMSLTDFCWNHEEVDLARLTRNALAHNGGRFGAALEKYRTRFVETEGTVALLLRGDQFNLVNGMIQFTPDNTKHLFNVLKDRVSMIVTDLA